MDTRKPRSLASLLALGAVLAALLLPSGRGARMAHAQGDPALVGQWSAVQTWPIVAVHMHLLPTGKVMFWPYGDGPRQWDPETAAITNLANSGYNLFCSGHSFTADGRLFVSGGHIRNNFGLANASYYDAATNTWTPLPTMNAGRWYPTNTTLANGDVLVVTGDIRKATNNDLPQVWQVASGSWRNLTSARLILPLYVRMFMAPNGRVFSAHDTSRYLDTAGTGAWTTVGNLRVSGRSNYGSAAMYEPGKIIFAGGVDPPTATAEIIDLNQASPAWQLTGAMAGPRRQNNVTILPDGKVLVTGGSSGRGFDNDQAPVLFAEMWDPAAGAWSTMASYTQYRGYHSTALLLPDARVLSAGGDNHPNAEVYSPPYLFKGARPTISSAPTGVTYSQTFSVGTPDPASISQVSWIRIASVTHANNMDQRFMRLDFTQGAGSVNVTAPSSANSSPPGYYMLFLLNGTGEPSVAKLIRIG